MLQIVDYDINNKNNKGYTMQKGASLLEILVALILLSIGLLGFADGEMHALHDAQHAYWQCILSQQLSSLADQLSISPSSHTAIKEWRQRLEKNIPAKILVTSLHSHVYQIEIDWKKPNKSMQSETIYVD